MNVPIQLGVNIDHSATVRQARYREFEKDCGSNIEPDPVDVALCAEKAGADGITLHPREDQRHIQLSDVRRMREAIGTRMNLEMACTDEMVDFALEIMPECVLLVPEKREEVTTEGGLDVASQVARVKAATQRLQEVGIEVSLFIDSDDRSINASAEIGADMVELHTGAYANLFYEKKTRKEELEKLIAGSELAHEHGILVNAGHGINYTNVTDLVTQVPHLYELNIGHAIISRAIFTGIDSAVREMRAKMHCAFR